MANSYTHSQYSVYQHQGIVAATVWDDMMDLQSLEPLGVFPSVVRAVQLFHIWHVVAIGTGDISISGQYSPLLIGPTPAGLILPMVPGVALQAPPHPRYVSQMPNTLQGQNWRI
jgi:hypothetical protein